MKKQLKSSLCVRLPKYKKKLSHVTSTCLHFSIPLILDFLGIFQIPVVRVHAIMAVARLQDPTDPEDAVTSAYLRMIGKLRTICILLLYVYVHVARTTSPRFCVCVEATTRLVFYTSFEDSNMCMPPCLTCLMFSKLFVVCIEDGSELYTCYSS